MRLALGDTLVIASHNPGKVSEIAALLDPLGVKVVCAADLGLPEPEEDGETFADNARLKALASARASGHTALADDSGLSVRALGGDPGVRSARWAGPGRDFGVAMAKIHSALGETPDRRAAFICALCLAWPDGRNEIFEGKIEGTLTWPPRGDKGFGYDPIFLPEGWSRTFAEVDAEQKHAVSHRARAFAKLLAALDPISHV